MKYYLSSKKDLLELGFELCNLRINRKITKYAMIKKGVNWATISKVESGDANLYIETLEKYLSAIKEKYQFKLVSKDEVITEYELSGETFKLLKKMKGLTSSSLISSNMFTYHFIKKVERGENVRINDLIEYTDFLGLDLVLYLNEKGK